jgi:hypothetical protein
VFFTTTQSLVNEDEAGTGEGNDLYEAEIEDGQLVKLVQVSHDPNAGQPAGLLGLVRVSADGSRVYFVAKGAVTGANAVGGTPVNGKNNLYVYDTNSGTTQFIAALAAGDSKDWATADNARSAQTTHDGRFLVFPSIEKLTGSEDTSTAQQLFEYDAETQRVARVSIGQQSATGYFCPVTKHLEAGFDCNGNISESVLAPAIPLPSYLQNDYPVLASSKLIVTEDGRVFFVSRAPLTPLAVEGSKNIYEYAHENVYLVASGENPQLEAAAFSESFNEHDRLIGTDESGTDVFMGAIGQLVTQDTDTQSDVYDARVEGGFPDIQTMETCKGESCRDAGNGPPLLPSSASGAVVGEVLAQNTAKSHVTPKLVARAPKLAKALRLCRTKARIARRRCEARARRRYGAAAGAKKLSREVK